MNRQTGIGMKDRYLMLIFKIVLLESSEVETESNDRWTKNLTDRGTENSTDRRKQFIKYKYLMPYLSNKKKEFLKSTVRTAFDTDHRFCLSVHPYARTDKKYK